MLYDALIVGGSYAGLSGAMQIARSGRPVCVLDGGKPRNRFAPHSHGFFGQDGQAPRQMIARARAEEQLRDPLTGLPNRQWLLERIWTALDDAERVDVRAALMLIDLDRFRSVNDTLGHLAGDRLLLQIADRLRAALPRGAEAARLGGDEFAVLLPVADSTTSATRIARALVARGRPEDQHRVEDLLQQSEPLARTLGMRSLIAQLTTEFSR